MKHFTFTKASMLKWGPAFWALFVGIVVTIGYLVYLDFKEIELCDCLIRYGGYILVVVAFVVWNTKRLTPDRVLHIHHYFIGFMVCSIVSY